MTLLTLELRVLAWLLLGWLAVVLVVLTHGAPVPAVVFAAGRRARRWRRARRVVLR